VKKIKFLITFCCLLITTSFFAQVKFSDQILNNVKKYGADVENSFEITETSNFQIDTNNRIVLKNGLRSSKYLNPDSWKSIKEDVEVNSISIVFSKYPIRKNGYSMNHKLLFNRLKNLFIIDPLLNDSIIDWKIILHTNCKNDIQVDSLFHGIIIEYKKDEETVDPIQISNTTIPNSNSASEVLETIESFNDLPNEVLLDLKTRNPIEKTEILIDYFEKLLKDTVATEVTPTFLKNHKHLINQFIRTYGNNNDSVVYKVFDRNRQWKNALIVADWTGSMYQYGAQALLWHTLNFETSGLEYFTLFNDGDLKSTKSKKLGETDGVYFEKADNIDKIVKLYQLVMLKGGGGDGPENDIEGILKGIEKYPMHSEIILIADNNACVRDMELLEYIDKPVRVIICGYDNKMGINPQYLHIAKETGGSLHTIDLDIHNLQVELNKKGEIQSLIDYDFKIGSSNCYNSKSIYPDSYFDNRIYTNLDSARSDKKRVVNLDLSSQSIEKIPSKIKKLKMLKSLNLSNNNISKITRTVYNSYYLETLDLSHNNISELPIKFSWLKKLKRLDLSYNKIDSIDFLPRLDYLIHLDLSNNSFSYLPTSLDFKNLQFLYLKNNDLMELPVSIGRLKKLKELSLSGNSLSVLTKRIGYLKKLEILDLSDNDISELPKEINRLRKLKTLILSGNNFTNDYIEYLKKILPNTTIENQ
jgi:Leucine-rich repeat (LRR) protein